MPYCSSGGGKSRSDARTSDQGGPVVNKPGCHPSFQYNFPSYVNWLCVFLTVQRISDAVGSFQVPVHTNTSWRHLQVRVTDLHSELIKSFIMRVKDQWALYVPIGLHKKIAIFWLKTGTSRRRVACLGEKRVHIEFWWVNFKQCNNLKDISVDGRMLLRWMLNKLAG